MGMGFVLTPEERDALVARDPRNAERIFPYLGGDEVNSSPTQMFERYVINFGQMSLEDARAWPELLGIVREKVKPERDRQKDKVARDYWWQHFRTRPALYAAIAPLSRCLVTSIVSKHLMFSFQPTDRVFSHKLYAFAFSRNSHFALLQSRVHEPWAWLLSSTMRNDLNYSASDCFETFPFPRTLDALEDIGERVYTARAAFMLAADIGLTKTYNALKDPANADPRILELRDLHVELDTAVLAAYGWPDIPVPPFDTPADAPARQHFDAEVLDRLFTLNAERAADEQRLGGRADRPERSD
jgi:hypothetical protein